MDLVKGLSVFEGEALTEALGEVIETVQRSLVAVQSGGRGLGAGVIWRQDGLILTNYHVVAHGRLQVSFPDGTVLPARLLAQEPAIDLAMLKVDATTSPVAKTGDARRLRAGQLVMAVGHPWGQRGYVTLGLVSGLGKAAVRGARGSVDIIRSDVSLAPGNSGGPLVDMSGAVIGINTMIVGGDLGVAIPIHVINSFASPVLSGLVDKAGNGSNGRRPWTSPDREGVV